jgi:hypothetical protein
MVLEVAIALGKVPVDGHRSFFDGGVVTIVDHGARHAARSGFDEI